MARQTLSWRRRPSATYMQTTKMRTKKANKCDHEQKFDRGLTLCKRECQYDRGKGRRQADHCSLLPPVSSTKTGISLSSSTECAFCHTLVILRLSLG